MNRSTGEAARISIVTLSYNKGRFLKECIRSVIEQDCPGLEYIVVDPGSTDGSRDIVQRYAPRISAQVLEPDRGPADGLNKGFALATAPLLGYLNGDDLFRPGTLRFVCDYFDRHPEVDVLNGAIRILDEHGRPALRKRTADRFDIANYAAGVCTVGQQATFFRRGIFDAAGGFNAGNRVAWDGELLVDMALAGAQFATVRKVLGDFRIYGGSITGSSDYSRKMSVYHDALRRKLAETPVRLHSPVQVRLKRLAYKLDVRRHLDYLLVT